MTSTTSTSATAPLPATLAPAPPRSDEAVIKCLQLTKVFRDFWLRQRVRAVDNIDLDVRRGEVFGLLGPNGSGKSTTIKMLLGLLNPTSGTLAVFGKRPEHVKNKALIGYLPEESYLYRFLNARETLDFYGRLFHIARHARRRRIDMLLEMVGMEHAAHRPVGEYSKGMQRKVGLAQALINDPELLVLDEPTSGMDPVATADVKRLLKTLAERGKTILLCSHLLADVQDVVHRAAIMYGGRVQALGTLDELLVNQSLTTLHTTRLPDALVEQIDRLLSAHGQHIERVEHPRQTLEAKFLDIVYKAQAQGLHTAGARSGRKVADFLAQGVDPARLESVGAGLSAEAATIIDHLMTGEKASDAPATPASVAAAEAQQQSRRDDRAAQAVLSSLLPPEAATPAFTPQAPGQHPDRAPDSQGGGDAQAFAVVDADLSVIDGLVAQTPTVTPPVPKAPPAPAAPSEEVFTAQVDRGEAQDAPSGPEGFDPPSHTPTLDDSGLHQLGRKDTRHPLDTGKPLGGASITGEKGMLDMNDSLADFDAPPSRDKRSRSGEGPDQGFIDALLDVPPPEDPEPGRR